MLPHTGSQINSQMSSVAHGELQFHLFQYWYQCRLCFGDQRTDHLWVLNVTRHVLFCSWLLFMFVDAIMPFRHCLCNIFILRDSLIKSCWACCEYDLCHSIQKSFSHVLIRHYDYRYGITRRWHPSISETAMTD